MQNHKHNSQSGQGLVEYFLIVMLVGLIGTSFSLAFGPQISNQFNRAGGAAPGATSAASAPGKPLTPIQTLLGDFKSRTLAYYAKYGRWPRSSEENRFTDLGLNPDDWHDPVQGVYWKPNGSQIGLANRKEDNLQVYVKDLKGNTLQLYDGWNIWCPVGSSSCYYHTVAPGNEVDISTVTVVQTSKKKD